MAKAGELNAPKSLTALGDDPLRAALSFLSVAECRRSVGATSKDFRAMATSTALARARFSDHYVLRGDRHGVVHFLATACGTRVRPTRQVRFDSTGPHTRTAWKVAAAPPAALQINSLRMRAGGASRPQRDSLLCFESAVVDSVSDVDLSFFTECSIVAGSYVEYQLPFALRVRSFRLAFGSCYFHKFQDWTFEAFDAEREEWRELYYCDESPWARSTAASLLRRAVNIPVDASFGSSRFRIRLAASERYSARCFHLRGFDLFGAILPPWRIDV
jgi:hypothetical protein